MFGLSERLSERLIQKVKSPIVLLCIYYDFKYDFYRDQFDLQAIIKSEWMMNYEYNEELGIWKRAIFRGYLI